MCHSYMIFSDLTATTGSIHPINSTHKLYTYVIAKKIDGNRPGMV